MGASAYPDLDGGFAGSKDQSLAGRSASAGGVRVEQAEAPVAIHCTVTTFPSSLTLIRVSDFLSLFRAVSIARASSCNPWSVRWVTKFSSLMTDFLMLSPARITSTFVGLGMLIASECYAIRFDSATRASRDQKC